MEMNENDLPLVSVGVTCYNQAKYVEETLDSILNQTYPKIELIILDDCSADNSVEVIENWISKNKVDCIFIKHEKNRGICKSANEILSKVTGKYLQGIAADDILLNDKLSRQVALLENSKETDALVFSDAYLINAEGELYQNRFIANIKRYLSLYSGNYYLPLLNVNFIPAMSILLKTQIIKSLNGYDERLIYEDYDIWLRIAKKYDFIFDDNVSVKYRLHESNFHKKIQNWELTGMQIYLKHLDREFANAKCKEILQELYLKKKPDFNSGKKLYFREKKPDDLLLYCIKLNIPPVLFRIMRYFLRYF
jgi:glycosyltransferase involved in cell wall biosynthesis